MIKIYENKITPQYFYNNHVLTNKPCVIKNFYKNDNCYSYYKNNEYKLKKYMIGPAVAYKIDNECINNFMSEIKKITSFVDTKRVWMHNKDNLTTWHYDGNGSAVINICISGKKRFYLSPPGTIPVYPLSSIGIKYIKWECNYVDIEKYDFLFIPAFWFHEVLTLEDNTFTINHRFFIKNNNNLFAANRDIYIYNLHKYLNTYMCKDNIICDITKDKSFLSSFLYGLYEVSIVFIIALLIFLFTYKINIIIFKILTCILFLTMIYLYFSNNIDDISSGVSKLMSLYILVFFITLFFLVKRTKKT
jgi:hypothetical protein